MKNLTRETNEVVSMLQEDYRDDIPKLKYISKLISNFQYKKRPRFYSGPNPASIIPEQMQLNPRAYNCSTSLLNSLQKNQICISHIDSREQYHIIYENFITLYRKHIPAGSRLSNEKPEVFVKHIKQFFLDTYLLTETYFSTITTILKNQLWIDVYLFTECVESLQINRFDYFYYVFRSPPKSVQASFDNQKVICKNHLVFFRFVDVQDKGTMSQLELADTFTFSFPNMKESEVGKKVHDIFMRCNVEKREIKICVTLDEIINIMY